MCLTRWYGLSCTKCNACKLRYTVCALCYWLIHCMDGYLYIYWSHALYGHCYLLFLAVSFSQIIHYFHLMLTDTILKPLILLPLQFAHTCNNNCIVLFAWWIIIIFGVLPFIGLWLSAKPYCMSDVVNLSRTMYTSQSINRLAILKITHNHSYMHSLRVMHAHKLLRQIVIVVRLLYLSLIFFNCWYIIFEQIIILHYLTHAMVNKHNTAFRILTHYVYKGLY